MSHEYRGHRRGIVETESGRDLLFVNEVSGIDKGRDRLSNESTSGAASCAIHPRFDVCAEPDPPGGEFSDGFGERVVGGELADALTTDFEERTDLCSTHEIEPHDDHPRICWLGAPLSGRSAAWTMAPATGVHKVP